VKTLFDINLDFEKSKGSLLYDKKSGRQFLDFFSLYSSLPLGYNHPVFDSEFEQKVLRVCKLRMTNNMFWSDELLDFFEKFYPVVFSKNIHLTCTGALAVESAIKCAMDVKPRSQPMVLSFKKSFHGINSWGFITDRFAATSSRMENYPRNNWLNLDFEAMVEFFNSPSVENLVAVVVEPIQSTAGDQYIPVEQLKAIENLCHKHNACLILDEIQTGFGVTGSMWYHEKIQIKPDILVFGKKAQVCGIVTNDKYAQTLNSPIQKLEVTYDGDLIDAIRSTYVLKAYRRWNLLEQVEKNSQIFKEILASSFENYRSSGHLIAFDLPSREVRDKFTKKCFDLGLLVNGTAEKSIRLRPNLAVSGGEIDMFESGIKKALGAM
jgi:L-lysine 6-transaminase